MSRMGSRRGGTRLTRLQQLGLEPMQYVPPRQHCSPRVGLKHELPSHTMLPAPKQTAHERPRHVSIWRTRRCDWSPPSGLWNQSAETAEAKRRVVRVEISMARLRFVLIAGARLGLRGRWEEKVLAL